jgi:hypothetical protein
MLRSRQISTNFESDLLQVGPFQKYGKTNNQFKAPILYNGKRLSIRFPKAHLKGIYYNDQFNTYSLLYPLTENNDEQTQFHKFMKALENEAQFKLEELAKSEQNNNFKNLRLPRISDLYRKSDAGEAMFIKFTSEGEDINCKQCYDFKQNKIDITDYQKCVGDYVVVVNIPGFFVKLDKKPEGTKATFQLYGNAVFTNAQPGQTLDTADILGSDLEESEEEQDPADMI